MDLTFNKQKKSIITLVLVYLLIVTFPYSLIIDREIVRIIVQLTLVIGYLVFYFYQQRQYQFNYPRLNKLSKHALLLIPFLLAPLSNLIYLLIDRHINDVINYNSLLINIPIVLIFATIEELLFRYLTLNFLKIKHGLFKAIVFSSLMFSSIHILNFFSHFDIITLLIQLAYTFGLGILCAIIYVETNNIMMPIIFHFLFNILNDNLYTLLVATQTDWLYYLVNISVVLIITGYILILIKMKLIKVNSVNEYETNPH